MQFTTILLATLTSANAAVALPARGDSAATVTAPTSPQGRQSTTVNLTLIANKGDDIPVTLDVIKGNIIKINEDNARDFTGIRLEDRGGLARLVQCQGRGDNGAVTDSFGFEDGDDDANVLALGAFILRAVACELKDPSSRRLGSSGALAGGSS